MLVGVLSSMSNRGPLPVWVLFLDAVALVYSALVLSVVCFGGVDVHFQTLRITATTLPRLLVVLSGAIALRHWLFPQRPLHKRLRAWAASMRRSRAIRVVLPVFVVSRVGVLTVGFLSVLLIGYVEDGPPFRVSDNELLNLSARWDAGWYLGIAQDGYATSSRLDDQQNIAFFPAYPMLMRTAGAFFGAGVVKPELTTVLASPDLSQTPRRRRLVVGGLFVALSAFFAALVYLYRLGLDCFDQETASASVLLLASYPFAVFFSAPYSESLFLLCAIGAFYHFRRHEYAISGGWGLVAGLTKANGCLLSIPLTIMALQQRGLLTVADSKRVRAGTSGVLRAHVKAFLAASMPGVGMLLFSSYLYTLTGRPLAWLDVHQLAWNRRFGSLGELIVGRAELLMTQGVYAYIVSHPIELLYVFAVVLALMLVWPVTTRLGLPYGVFLLVTVVPPLMAGGFVSVGRFTSILFPMFLYLALILPKQWRVPVAVVSSQLQALSAVLFYTWRPLY